jgi:hypothetical protein
MTFLNSAILAALTLGLLPILIHLLNRQRFKNVDFPTLRFLRELQRQKMRQVKIRQILLLILRTLAIIFLVLALARPVVKSSAGLLPGAEARTTAVLILDRSASMQTETADGTRFRRLQTRAQAILQLLKDGDEAQIVWADSPPEAYPEQPTGQIRVLREAVSEAKATTHAGNLVEALRRARQTLGQSQNLHKEVYLVSDFSVSAWPEQMPSEPLLPKDTHVYLVSTDAETVRNVGVTDAGISSRIITPGRPVEVSFTVKNSGRDAVSDHIVSVYLLERRVAQTRVSLAAGESRTLRLKFTPQEPGDQVGSVRLEDADDLAADDQRYFVLRVPSRLKVAVVGADGPARDLSALALNPAGNLDAFVDPKPQTLSQLESEDWNDLDAIVMADASGVGEALAPRLGSFVAEGKGVLVMMGSQADLRAYGSWLSALGLPTPVEVWQGESPARWTTVDLAHPLFEGLFEEKPASISPEIRRMVRVPAVATAVEVIGTSAGIPFLLESKLGRGRAMLMTSSPDPQWSTLYRTGIFAPLMVSSAAYLSGVGTSGTDYQFESGVPATLAFAGTPGEERYELRGGTVSIVPAIESSQSGYVLKFPALNETGAYELWKGNHRVASAAVNVPARESELRLSPKESYESVLGGQITELGRQDDVEAAVMQSRYGRELWKLCLSAALFLLLAEMLIGRVGKREVAMAS